MYIKIGNKRSLLLCIAISTLFSINFLLLYNYQQANAQNNYNNINYNNTSITENTYTNSTYSINMKYPDNWREDPQSANELNKALAGIPEVKIKYLSFFYANDGNDSNKNYKGLSPPYVALAIDENVKNESLLQYTNNIKNLVGGNNITSEKATLANNSAIELNYLSTDVNTNDVLNITNTVTTIDNKNNRIYIFLDSLSVVDHQEYAPIIKHIKNSFTLQQQDNQTTVEKPNNQTIRNQKM